MLTALIAEDEPLLAAALKAELALAWPDLAVVATVSDGASAVAQALALQPDVLFFDIQMPGMSGLDAAAELLDAWPPPSAGYKPFPALVFVTAFDQYAVAAFEAQAMDYLLKPVQSARLLKTVQKVQLALKIPDQAAPDYIAKKDDALERTMTQLRALMTLHSTSASPPPLSVIAATRAGSPHTVQLIQLAEVVYFEATDKYVRVLTSDDEFLIRTPLKELIVQLDADEFWQIHRSAVVRVRCIHAAHRDGNGKTIVSLIARSEKLQVSRLYAHLFKAM